MHENVTYPIKIVLTNEYMLSQEFARLWFTTPSGEAIISRKDQVVWTLLEATNDTYTFGYTTYLSGDPVIFDDWYLPNY